jgi:hypothetical protein
MQYEGPREKAKIIINYKRENSSSRHENSFIFYDYVKILPHGTKVQVASGSGLDTKTY